jgi:hypothetical protein
MCMPDPAPIGAAGNSNAPLFDVLRLALRAAHPLRAVRHRPRFSLPRRASRRSLRAQSVSPSIASPTAQSSGPIARSCVSPTARDWTSTLPSRPRKSFQPTSSCTAIFRRPTSSPPLHPLPAEATETFHLAASDGQPLLHPSVWTQHMVVVSWVELTRIDFADGTTWQSSTPRQCSACPQPLRPRPTPAERYRPDRRYENRPSAALPHRCRNPASSSFAQVYSATCRP